MCLYLRIAVREQKHNKYSSHDSCTVYSPLKSNVSAVITKPVMGIRPGHRDTPLEERLFMTLRDLSMFSVSWASTGNPPLSLTGTEQREHSAKHLLLCHMVENQAMARRWVNNDIFSFDCLEDTCITHRLSRCVFRILWLFVKSHTREC